MKTTRRNLLKMIGVGAPAAVVAGVVVAKVGPAPELVPEVETPRALPKHVVRLTKDDLRVIKDVWGEDPNNPKVLKAFAESKRETEADFNR